MKLVKVRYLKDNSSGRYTYYAEEALAVGDRVKVDARGRTMDAEVTDIDVPEEEIAAFRDKVKIIPAGSKWAIQPKKPEAEPAPGPTASELEDLPDWMKDEPSADTGAPGFETDLPTEEEIDQAEAEVIADDAAVDLPDFMRDDPPKLPESLKIEPESLPENRPEEKLISAAAEAQEMFGDDELERYAADNPVQRPMFKAGEELHTGDMVALNEQGLGVRVIPNPLPEPDPGTGTAQTEAQIVSIVIRPELDPGVARIIQQGNRLREFALARVIATEADLTSATEDLTIIARVTKELTGLKELYYRPIKQHLDTVTAVFSSITAPLEEADKVTRSKVIAFTNEQKRRAAEIEAVNRQAEELARRQAALNNGEFTVDTKPIEAPAPVRRVVTNIGSATTKKVRKWKLVNFSKVPDDCKQLDNAKINRIVKAGGTIDGIETWEEDGLQVNTR